MAPTKPALKGFTQLNPSTFYLPPLTSTPKAPRAPSLILLLSWMGATPRHISKYAQHYTALYLGTAILTVTTSATNVLWNSASTNVSRLAPALEVLLALQPDEKILLHFFSNGGGITGAMLAKAYVEKTRRALNVKAVVMDSAPGIPTYSSSVRAFSVSLPRNIILRVIGGALLRIAFILYIAVFWLLRRKERVRNMRGELNDPRIFAKDAKRLYVFSEADQMVLWKDVNSHADDAEAKGYLVTREKFEGSGHASHMLVNPERYWGAVQNLWDSANS